MFGYKIHHFRKDPQFSYGKWLVVKSFKFLETCKMEVPLTFTQDIIKTCKCSLCNSYLSIPPINTVSEDGKKNLCGRCKNFASKTSMRNLIFENIAKCLPFPCIYENCTEMIPWGQVELHERTCIHRSITCPVSYQCSEVVKLSNLESHFKDKHEPNTKYGKVVAEIKISHSVVILLILNHLQFFIYIFLNDKLSMSVFSVQAEATNYKYNVKLTSRNYLGFALLFENQKVKSYDSRKFCFYCLQKKCTLAYHEYSKANKSEVNAEALTTKLKMPSLQDLLENSNAITFTIDVFADQKESNVDFNEKCIAQTETKQGIVNEKELNRSIIANNNQKLLQKNLECPICQEYMVPPIYTCLTGHTICSGCRSKLTQCPTCKSEFGNVRNFALEELSDNIEMTCQNDNWGCGFIGNVQKVQQHQENDCEYKL